MRVVAEWQRETLESRRKKGGLRINASRKTSKISIMCMTVLSPPSPPLRERERMKEKEVFYGRSSLPRSRAPYRENIGPNSLRSVCEITPVGGEERGEERRDRGIGAIKRVVRAAGRRRKKENNKEEKTYDIHGREAKCGPPKAAARLSREKPREKEGE